MTELSLSRAGGPALFSASRKKSVFFFPNGVYNILAINWNFMPKERNAGELRRERMIFP